MAIPAGVLVSLMKHIGTAFMSASPVLLVISIILFFVTSVFSNDEIDWEDRKPKICANDPKYTRPTDHGNSLDVYVEVMILHIYDISEEKMEFGMQIYLIMKWRDEMFNVSDLNIDRPYTMPDYVSKCLWMPDVIFMNCKFAVNIQILVPNSVFKLLPDGFVYHYSRYQLVVNCLMDFRLYPMDKQTCFLQIGLLYSRSKDAELRWMGEDTSGKLKFPSIVIKYPVKNPQFEMQEPVPEKIIIEWQSGNATELLCKLTFDRYITSSLLNTYIPSFLVVCLSFVSFWLDVESVPGRVTLGVTSLLTLSTQIVSARSSLPSINYMTALDIWLFGCLVLVFLSLIEFTLANTIKRMKTNNDHVRTWKELIHRMTRRIYPKLNFEKKDGNAAYSKSKGLAHQDSAKKTSLCRPNIDIDRVSRVLFPVTMVSFATLYWLLFISKID